MLDKKDKAVLWLYLATVLWFIGAALAWPGMAVMQAGNWARDRYHKLQWPDQFED